MTERNYLQLTDDELRDKQVLVRRLKWSTNTLTYFGVVSIGLDMIDGRNDSVELILGILTGSILVNYLLYYWADSTLERKARERNDN